MSRLRAALLVSLLLGAMVTVVVVGLRTLERDSDELVARFDTDWMYRVNEATLELEDDFNDIVHDLELAARLSGLHRPPADIERQLAAIVAVGQNYRAMHVFEPDGTLRVSAQVPAAAPNDEPAFAQTLENTVRRALASPGHVTASSAIEDTETWLRVFAFAPIADTANGAVALIVDTQPLFGKLNILSAAPSARLLILGAHGRPAPASDPTLAGAIRSVGERSDTPGLAALAQRMLSHERGVMHISRDEIERLGLGNEETVAVHAPIDVQDGAPWSIALLASIEPLRAHERAMTRRIVGTIAAVAVFLAAIAAIILVMSRRAVALRVRAEQADRLAHLHEKAEKIVDTIPTGVVAIGADGTVTALNRVLRERLGAEGGARTLEDAFPASGEGVPDRLRALTDRALATDRVVSAFGETMALFGEEGQYNLHAVPLEPRFADARVLLVIEDVSMLRSLESQLLHSEKLATVGVLAAGIAHEVGTPLGIVRGRAELARRKLGADHPVAEGQTIIVEQIDKVSRVIRQVLDFSRSGSVDVHEVDLLSVSEAARDLLAYEAERRGATLEIDVAPGLPAVIADPDQLQQLLVNLVINALDACQPGGRVRVAARPGRAPGTVRIQVEDDGPGIPEELRNQIFDPFFTTKKRGKGTGLGLSIVSQIARAHHARIEVHSERGCGTVMTLVWPAAARTTGRQSVAG